MQKELNSLYNFMQVSIFCLGIPKSLWAGKFDIKLTRHKGSSKSLSASTKLGYLSLTK